LTQPDREAGCPPKPWRRRAVASVVRVSRSETFKGQRYVGMTSDINRRLSEHDEGKSSHTSLPWRLVTFVAFSDRQKAEAFKRYLKSGSGHAFAKRRLWQRYRAHAHAVTNITALSRPHT